MPLELYEVKLWNPDPDVSYRLIIKDGDKFIGHTNAIGPTCPGVFSFSGRKLEITGPLTLIAERV